MQAEQIEQIIAAAVPGGLEGSFYQMTREESAEWAEILWHWVPSPEQKKRAEAIFQPIRDAYILWRKSNNYGSQEYLEGHTGVDWRNVGGAACVAQMLEQHQSESEALRDQVSTQAAETERLKAQLAASNVVDLNLSSELMIESASIIREQLKQIEQARVALKPALPLAGATYALAPDPSQANPMAAAIVAAADALGAQDA